MIRSPLTARNVLIVAPHPDDETIGAWGLIRQLRGKGARIEVLVVSDGAASHPGSRTWSVKRLVKQRRRETLRAMRELGLAPDAVRFLALPDGELESLAPQVRMAIGKALRRQRRPDLIVGPECADAHSDHRAVADALAAVPHAGERRLGYHVWPVGAANGPRIWQVKLKGVARSMKRRAVCSYRTQMGIITDAVDGFAMNHRHLSAFAGPQETFAVLA